MAHLGEFETLLLLALVRLGDDAYGAAIRDEVQQRTGRNVAVGALYTALARLEARRLVKSRMGAPTARRGGRRRKHYALTPTGLRALADAARGWRAMTEDLELERLLT